MLSEPLSFETWLLKKFQVTASQKTHLKKHEKNGVDFIFTNIMSAERFARKFILDAPRQDPVCALPAVTIFKETESTLRDLYRKERSYNKCNIEDQIKMISNLLLRIGVDTERRLIEKFCSVARGESNGWSRIPATEGFIFFTELYLALYGDELSHPSKSRLLDFVENIGPQLIEDACWFKNNHIDRATEKSIERVERRTKLLLDGGTHVDRKSKKESRFLRFFVGKEERQETTRIIINSGRVGHRYICVISSEDCNEFDEVIKNGAPAHHRNFYLTRYNTGAHTIFSGEETAECLQVIWPQVCYRIETDAACQSGSPDELAQIRYKIETHIKNERRYMQMSTLGTNEIVVPILPTRSARGIIQAASACAIECIAALVGVPDLLFKAMNGSAESLSKQLEESLLRLEEHQAHFMALDEKRPDAFIVACKTALRSPYKYRPVQFLQEALSRIESGIKTNANFKISDELHDTILSLARAAFSEESKASSGLALEMAANLGLTELRDIILEQSPADRLLYVFMEDREKTSKTISSLDKKHILAAMSVVVEKEDLFLLHWLDLNGHGEFIVQFCLELASEKRTATLDFLSESLHEGAVSTALDRLVKVKKNEGHPYLSDKEEAHIVSHFPEKSIRKYVSECLFTNIKNPDSAHDIKFSLPILVQYYARLRKALLSSDCSDGEFLKGFFRGDELVLSQALSMYDTPMIEHLLNLDKGIKTLANLINLHIEKNNFITIHYLKKFFIRNPSHTAILNQAIEAKTSKLDTFARIEPCIKLYEAICAAETSTEDCRIILGALNNQLSLIKDLDESYLNPKDPPVASGDAAHKSPEKKPNHRS